MVNRRRLMAVVLGSMAYWGYAFSINTSAAPFLASDFGLNDAAIAWAFGCIGLGAVGTLALSRQVDRLGRRRLLLGCLAAFPVVALVSAAAPNVETYVFAQVFAQAVNGTLFATVTVMIAEELPVTRRASGQGVAGVAGSLGNGIPLIMLPVVAQVPGTWRWLWLVGVIPVVALPFIRRTLPETTRWQRVAARGDPRQSRMRDLLHERYRRRTIGVIVSQSLLNTAVVAGQTWLIYHPVRTLGLSPMVATAVVIIGGAVGLLGYPVGARLSDRWGRRKTFAVGTTLLAFAAFVYYSIPATFEPSPAVGMLMAFMLWTVAGNAASVAHRSLVTELFPTCLRATLQGWIAVCWAVAIVGAHFTTAALALKLGGLAPAVSILQLLCLGSVVAVLALLSETAGLDLETASLEGPAPIDVAR